MDSYAPLHKKPRPDVFLNGSGPFHFDKPFLPPLSQQGGFPFADHVSRFRASSAIEALAAERESLSTGLGSKKACVKFFSTSGCPYGENCHFSHYLPGGLASLGHLQSTQATGGGALGTTRKDLVYSSSLSSFFSHAGAHSEPGSAVPDGFKSRLCKNFESLDGCRFGHKCHFAHGENELRKPNDSIFSEVKGFDIPGFPPALDHSNSHDGYKTRLCKNFDTPEGCRFGKKCNFAHGEKELRKANGSDKLPHSVGKGIGGIIEDNLGVIAPREPTPPGLAAAASFGAVSTAKISIDASLAGVIIGKGGVNAKSISRLTGARIYVRENESDASLRNIEMEGSFDQIKQASATIRELLVHIDASPGKPSSLGSHSYKTKLCENFPKGSCTFGERCHFAHGSSELRAAPTL